MFYVSYSVDSYLCTCPVFPGNGWHFGKTQGQTRQSYDSRQNAWTYISRLHTSCVSLTNKIKKLISPKFFLMEIKELFLCSFVIISKELTKQNLNLEQYVFKMDLWVVTVLIVFFCQQMHILLIWLFIYKCEKKMLYFIYQHKRFCV